MLELAAPLFEEKKDKDVVASIQGIPITARSNTTLAEILAASSKKSLIVDDEETSPFV